MPKIGDVPVGFVRQCDGLAGTALHVQSGT
jgi:hypothetical protein